ncbi:MULTISPECIES: hypothetical protein [Mesotoga]|uniref:hypothetical protein n=1 Tax=Mesotoga TaxID=1184396 RepID=UPI0002CCC064|nr:MULTISPECIES: hypothetical protein [Mesotoga]CCU84798.1 conserved hypothetical protein [Mesotoga infera]HPE54139.1 hypothetical protein [Mesotoga prima]HRX65759.1 hypothetical protein [Mesotoga sp.]
MRVHIRSFWQMAGAVAIKRYDADCTITENLFETQTPKKTIFENALKDMLNKNGKPWVPNLRPFLKQYTVLDKVSKILEENKIGSKVCSLCGSRVSTLEKLSMLGDPLSVKAENFQSFFSFGSGSGEVCLDCQFLGMMAGLALFYTSYKDGQDYVITYLFPESDTLESTYSTFLWMKDLHEPGSWRNLKVKARFYPQEPYETLILSLHTLFEKTRFIPRSSFKVMQVSNTGRNNSFLNFDSFERVEELTTFFENVETLGGDFSKFMDSLVIPGSPSADVSRREEISRMILSFKPLEERLQMIMFDFDYPVRSIYEVIVASNTMKGVNGLDQMTIDLSKKAGEVIGNAVFEAQSFGDLYSLRNSRSLEDLLLTLADLEFKYAKEDWKIRIPEEFIRILNEETWKKPKALLVIFAVNKYLSRHYASSQNGGEKIAD